MLPHGSISAFGAVKVDGTTITATGGVISSVGGSGCTAATNYCVGMFNIQAYGADPTGVSDSTTAIASAITAAEGVGDFGGTVYGPAGKYSVSNITLPASHQISHDLHATLGVGTAEPNKA